MMGYCLIILILSAVCSLAGSQYHQVCVDALLAKNSIIERRFSRSQLNEVCRKDITWQEEAVTVQFRSSKRQLSPNQKAWLDQVRVCQNLLCICNSIDLCDEIVSQVAAPIQQIGSSLSGLGANWIHELGPRGGAVPGRNPNPNKNRKNRGREKKNNRGNRRRQNGPGNGRGNGWPPENRGQEDGRFFAHNARNKRQSLGDRFKLKKAVRKEYRMMTEDERKRFQRAVMELKNDAIDGISKYDILVIWHTPEESPGAHFGAALLPFHRELLKQFEIALRQIDPSVGLPYWDSTLDEPLPDPAHSILWTDLFMGSGKGEVLTGPFSNWTTIRDSTIADLSPKRKIVRDVGKAEFGGLYKEIDIKTIQSKSQFRDLVYCIDPYFELVHGTVHMWIGGHMGELRVSPNDPTFFLLHSFVDMLWEDFRQNQQSATVRETEYTNRTESCSQFQLPDAVMKPFKIKNRDGLSNKYTEIFYEYSPRPTCSRANMDCGSPYLFCYDRNLSPVCISKVKIGGNCTGFEQEDICYLGQCVSGKCDPIREIPPPTTEVYYPTTTALIPLETFAPFTFGPVARFPLPMTTTPKPGLPQTVWFPIMVLSIRDGGVKEFRDVNILSDHKSPTNMKLFGDVASLDQVPTYTGAAYAQVVSPFANDGRSEASLYVTDERDRDCVSLCLRGTTAPWTYAPCKAKVVLDADPRRSDDIPFTPFRDQAKYLNWRGEKKMPDPFLFVCHAEIVDNQPRASPRQIGHAIPQPRPRPRQPFSQSRPNSTHFTRPGTARVIELPWNRKSSAGIQRQALQTNSLVMKGDGNFRGIDREVNIDQITQPVKNQRADGGCHDLHRCCLLWASVGECMRNWWMQKSCQMSCFVCNKGKNENSNVCNDYHSKCYEWANRGNCGTDVDWMEENCKKSCGVCNRTIDQLKPICGASKTGGCTNSDQRCNGWANSGECSKNPWWMKENCPSSCGHCSS